MLLLRVQLPDRPGSLGAVATAMGAVGADIEAIEIVERGPGHAVNDFMLNLPPQALPDSLISACHAVEGVSVLWVSRYPENWGIESDIEAVDQMTSNPEKALEVLTSRAPRVFHCQWALSVDENGTFRERTDLAPDPTPETLAALGDLDQQRTADLAEGWLPGWGETTIAVEPLRGGGAIVLGRLGGPGFLASEVRRLQHLAAMAF